MDWKISTKEEYQNFAQELCLPSPSRKSLVAFALRDGGKDFALSETPPPDESFPLAVLSWEELRHASTWRNILQLYPIEKSTMAYYWYSVLRTRSIDAGVFLESYGLRIHFQSHADWEELGQLGEKSRALARAYDFPLRILRLWNRISETEQSQWLKIWEKYNFGRNLIQDIICDYYELDISIRKELLEEFIKESSEEALSLKQKGSEKERLQAKFSAREARLIRDKVRELRLPKIKEMQREVYQAKRKLSEYLGANVDLQVPEDLEAHFLALKLRFSTIEELGQSVASLGKAEALAIIKNLLKML